MSTHIRSSISSASQDVLNKRKEGKDQESIQSSTTPDPRHRTGK